MWKSHHESQSFSEREKLKQPQGGAPARNRKVGANKSNFALVFVGDISIYIELRVVFMGL
jgi:hypothetical protein